MVQAWPATYALAFQINVGGQLRRERPRFCADCGLPLGYYSDMRSACGVKSLLLERCRYMGRLAGLCRVPPCPFRIFGNDLCEAVLAFVLGDYDVARRLRARCVIWQLTMNQLSVRDPSSLRVLGFSMKLRWAIASYV